MKKIYCPICREVFQETDVVLLDFINTVSHLACYTNSFDLVTDMGTFKELVEKYPFFQERVH